MEAVMSACGAVAVLLLGWVARDKFMRRWNAIEQRLRLGRQRRRRSKIRDGRRQAPGAAMIVSIYQQAGRGSALVVPDTTLDRAALPLLRDPLDRFVHVVDPYNNGPFVVNTAVPNRFPVDTAAVKRYERMGMHLWDGPVLYCVGASSQTEALVAELRLTNFFAYLSHAERVAARLGRRAELQKLLLVNYPDFASSLTSPGAVPLAVGADLTCVFTDGTRTLVPLHMRSETVVNAHSLWTVTPAFGLEANWTGSRRSHFGILYYNAFKELLEEFWDIPEIRHVNDRPRAHPDWIFDTDPGRRLVTEHENGHIELCCTGAVVDLTYPCLVLSLQMNFSSPEFLDCVMKTGGSSEAAWAETGEPIFRFEDPLGPFVTDRMTTESMKVTSIFALDRTRNSLQTPT